MADEKFPGDIIIASDQNSFADAQNENIQRDLLEPTKGVDADAISEPLHADGDQVEQSSESLCNPPFVKEAIDVQLLEQLLDMGVNLLRAEKAIYYSLPAPTLDGALMWLESNEDSSDIDEPVPLGTAPSPKALISPEEAEKRAYELQKKMREVRIAREKEEEIERERARIADSKALREHTAKLEEDNRKRQIALLLKQKEDAKNERERQRQLMREDYKRRFGVEMPESEGTPSGRMSGKDRVAAALSSFVKTHKISQQAALVTCLQTIKIYCNNAKDNPTEEKFKQIRKANNAFCTRVLPLKGSLDILVACGFVDDGEFLKINGSPDGFVLAQAVKFIDIILTQCA